MRNITDIVVFTEGVLTSPIHEMCENAIGETDSLPEVVRAAILWAAESYSEEDFVATASRQLRLTKEHVIDRLTGAIQINHEVLDYLETLSHVFSVHVSSDLPPPLFDKLLHSETEFFENVVRSIIDPNDVSFPTDRETTLLVAWNVKMLYSWNEAGWDAAVFPDLFRFDRELKLRGYML